MSFKTLYEGRKHLAGTPGGLFWSEDKPIGEIHKTIAEALYTAAGTKAYSVADIGCGYATLRGSLPPEAHYVGTEPVEWIRREARKNTHDTIYPLTAAEFAISCTESGEKYDFAVCLGVLATTPAEDLKTVIQSLFAIAHLGVVLSFQNREIGGYTGRFQAQSMEQIEEAAGAPIRYLWTFQNDTEVLTYIERGSA